jgi:hypothetical protein
MPVSKQQGSCSYLATAARINATDALCSVARAQIGYRTVNSSAFRPLVWHPSEEVGASRTDGSWGCPDAAQPYPAMHHSLVHPCVASATGPTCCGYSSAAFNLRFLSFVTAPRGMLLMAYEVGSPFAPYKPAAVCLGLRRAGCAEFSCLW